jgi:hypothetical protein
MSVARETVGLHEYDGKVQDLSPSGVAAALSRIGVGPAEPDRHDEAHLRAAEAGALAWMVAAEDHRRSPSAHLGNLDLACYDREYAPPEVRAEARRAHLGAWPDAVDAAIESLDRMPASVARALLPSVRGLGAGLVPEDPVTSAGLAALDRLVAHVEQATRGSDETLALGAELLAKLMGEPEAMVVDVGRLARVADVELARLKEMLTEASARLAPDQAPADLVAALGHDHPAPDEIAHEASELIREVSAFTIEHNLLGDLGGECRVGPAPESRRWAMAMMVWSAPYEQDGPSWYHVTPPDPTWSDKEQEEWMAVFSRTALPAITVHEVTPGHFSHGRFLRSVRGDVRRGLFSGTFEEGWAHYAEELFLEEGFRGDDPRFCIGVCVEALVRVTRMRVAIGVHTGAMTMADAVAAFETDALLNGPAARSEAERSTYDPSYGRYTWGKLEILALREEARAAWGARYSHRRFHDALLSYGAPPLGLIGDILV